GQPHRLLGEPIAVVASDDRAGDATTATDVRPAAAGAGVAGPFLAVELLGRAAHLAAGAGLVRALTTIRLVHHHDVVQQLLADPRGNRFGVDLVLTDLSAGGVVDGQTNHGN